MHPTLLFLRNVAVLLMLLSLLILLDNHLSKLHAASTSIIINEVLYDPAGTDTGNEWIELYNISNQTVNLENWQIQVAGTTFKTTATLSGNISPKSIFLVCEPNISDCDLTVSKLSFQNGGDATDGIQITDQTGTVIDAVFYDLPNKNLLTDESGNLVQDTLTAPITDAGESLGRSNYIDTDNYLSDFSVFKTTTPGQENLVEQQNNDELEETGANPLVTFIAFIFFIILIYSARLIKYNKFIHQNNGTC